MKKKFLFLCLIFLIFIRQGFSLYNRFGIPDSSEIRKDLIETWFEAPLGMVRMNSPEIRMNSIGEKFQIRMEETEDTFCIFVAPFTKIEVDFYSSKGKETILKDVYPGDGIGGWVLVRDKKTGKPINIKCYFTGDSEVFIQFSSIKGNAYSDFLIYNFYAARSVSTGLPFERFYTASFEEIVNWTSGMLPWQYTRIFKDGYHASQQMINIIKEKLIDIVFTEDAMYDGDGESVFISSGKKIKIEEGYENKIIVSGAGFLKWIADGITEPITGSYLKRNPLLARSTEFKNIGFQGVMSEKYDVFFSLDWIRNLASAVVSIRSGRRYLYNESGTDVTLEPFAAEITEQGVRNVTGFIKNTGYQASALKPLLYVLAAIEPETFYFTAIRQTDRRTPEVKVFNECAVIFPYFDSSGRFKCTLFKDGAEMSFEDFFRRYCRDYLFLTRVQCAERFYPR